MPYNNTHIKGWLRVILVIVAYLFVGGVFNVIGKLIADVDIEMSLNEITDYQKLVITFFDFLGLLCVISLFLKIIDGESFKDIGLNLKNKTKSIVFGILAGLLIMSLSFLILTYCKEIEIDKIYVNFKNLIYIFLLYFTISLKEEILLRGYVLRNFMYSFNKYFALVLSSLLFSIMHGLNPNFDVQAFINLFLAGILLGLPYTFNKNLWFPIAFHFSWNFFQSLFGFNVSGIDSYSLIEINIPEPNLINGGEYGFEDSVVSIVVQFVIIIMILIYYQKKKDCRAIALRSF
jgi:membrane protease YdiL (CAAX protease family)